MLHARRVARWCWNDDANCFLFKSKLYGKITIKVKMFYGLHSLLGTQMFWYFFYCSIQENLLMSFENDMTGTFGPICFSWYQTQSLILLFVSLFFMGRPPITRHILIAVFVKLWNLPSTTKGAGKASSAPRIHSSISPIYGAVRRIILKHRPSIL